MARNGDGLERGPRVARVVTTARKVDDSPDGRAPRPSTPTEA